MAEFDPGRMARRMQAAGAGEELAEATADEVNGAVAGLSTRADLEVLRAEMRGDMQTLRADMRADMDVLRADVRADMEALRADVRADMQALRADMEALRAEMRADLQTAFHAQTWRLVTFGVALAAVVVAAIAGIVAALV